MIAQEKIGVRSNQSLRRSVGPRERGVSHEQSALEGTRFGHEPWRYQHGFQELAAHDGSWKPICGIVGQGSPFGLGGGSESGTAGDYSAIALGLDKLRGWPILSLSAYLLPPIFIFVPRQKSPRRDLLRCPVIAF